MVIIRSPEIAFSVDREDRERKNLYITTLAPRGCENVYIMLLCVATSDIQNIAIIYVSDNIHKLMLLNFREAHSRSLCLCIDENPHIKYEASPLQPRTPLSAHIQFRPMLLV